MAPDPITIASKGCNGTATQIPTSSFRCGPMHDDDHAQAADAGDAWVESGGSTDVRHGGAGDTDLSLADAEKERG